MRRQNGDEKRRTCRTEAADALVEFAGETYNVVYPPNTITVTTQTDLTVVDLPAIEEDHHRRTTEFAEMCVAKGYSSQESLKSTKKVLHFYTGLSSFMVLISLFRLVSVAIPEGGAAKLGKFDYFIPMLMKLWLKAGNYDLGF